MEIKKALNVIPEKLKEKSICESCGDEFSCGATRNSCWCMNLELTDEARNEIKSKYNDCLCSKCLEQFAS